MEFIEEYKGYRILKDVETGFFKAWSSGAHDWLNGALVRGGGDVSNINFLKKIIDIKIKL